MQKQLFILFVLLSQSGYSQKKELIELMPEVIEAATKELNESMQPPEGKLFLFKSENQITGEYVLDITIHEKGTVASVFISGSEGGNIKNQNMLKDFIKDYEFSFKMPKGKKYKFQYIFKFD
jgi:hypothetical protein